MIDRKGQRRCPKQWLKIFYQIGSVPFGKRRQVEVWRDNLLIYEGDERRRRGRERRGAFAVV